ncbi:hypothetical protein N7530_009779 [Penicillium desertorum]|uniref:Uncharacterized protein n=1 Tax=Penicillium desertorum TaxID=1303715 RepID=A0A9W9WJ39_9EURO|nr:hypothetical protein N7530_009779 [Penicillium desertorum]
MTYQATGQFQWTLDVNAERRLNQWMDHAYKRLRAALDREAQKANQELRHEVALVKNEDLRSKEKLLLEENRHRRTKEELRLEENRHRRTKEELRLEKDEHEKTKQNFVQLIEELRNEHHKALDQLNESLQCKICYTHQDRWGMLQCGHMRSSPAHSRECGEDCGNGISWVDVIREGPLQAEKHNEKYRFRLQNRREVFETTQFDFNLIVSRLPRKLVHPETHTSDILAEISAIDLLASEVRAWKSAAAEVTENIDDSLNRLTERLNKLEDIDVPGCLFQEPIVANTGNGTPCPGSNSAPMTRSSGKKRRSA